MNRYYNNWEENECWVNLRDFPNHQLSTYGRVRNKKTGYILKPFPDRYGYMRLSIGSTDNVYIHRLMCETFYCDPPFEEAQSNHLNTVRTDNHIFNLEWSTPSDNIKWSVDYGNIDPYKASMKAKEINMKPVRIIETGQIFASVTDCADYLGVASTNVSKAARHRCKVHGYHIEYIGKEDM